MDFKIKNVIGIMLIILGASLALGFNWLGVHVVVIGILLVLVGIFLAWDFSCMGYFWRTG